MTSISENCSSSQGQESVPETASEALVASKLARDVLGAEALGLRNMPWKVATDTATAMAVLDVDWLIQQPLLPYLVPAIPAGLLHRSLVAHGLEDSVEVVEWLRGKQLTRVLDYDIWMRDTERMTDDVNPTQIILWFRLWLEVGNEFAAERVFDLDEETLVVLLTKVLDIQPEGIGRVAPELEDSYWATLDGRFHLRVLDENPETFEIVKAVIDALYAVNAKYAATILSHASMLVRDESLELANRWREARLADAGFVERGEALAALRQKSMVDVKAAAQAAMDREREQRTSAQRRRATGSEAEPVWGGYVEDRQELEEEYRALLNSAEEDVAANLIATGVGAESYRALLAEVNNNTNVLLTDEEAVENVVDAILGRSLALLAAVDAVSTRGFKQHRLLVERIFSALAESDALEAANVKARLARITNLVVSGTSSGSDTDALERALAVVRGAVNIGLETLVREGLPGEQAAGGSADEAILVARGLEVLRLVGVEHLFQVGWNLELSASESFAAAADELSQFSLADGSRWLDLWRGQRFVALRKGLDELGDRVDAGLHHVAASLLNRVPLFPEVLAQQESSFRASSVRRAYETLSEIDAVRGFAAQLPTLVME
jgi:hypothetical protein